MNGERYQQAMSQIGRYELVAEIARGGMGVVYQAYEPALERRLLLGAAGGLAVVAVTLLAMLLARGSGGGAIGLSAPRAGVPSPRQVVWSYAGDRGLAGGPAPLAAEGMVIVGTLDGRIVALHAASGELSWSAGGDSTVLFGAPSASGELVFVGSTDGLVQGLSLRSGKATWQTRVVGVAQEAPALDGGRLIVTTDKGYIYMLQAGSGQVIWDRPLSAAPAAEGGTIYVADQSGGLAAISFTSASMLWRFEAGAAIMAAPLLADGRLFFGAADGRFYSLAASDGEELASLQLGGSIVGTPALADGLIIVRADRVYALGE